MIRSRVFAVCLLVLAVSSVDAACEGPLALQILGSGGPIADDDRASSAYALWSDGRTLALVDAGGGSHLRAAQAGVNLAEIQAIHLSHLHADHSAGLPALLKSAWFVRRGNQLVVSGPGPGGRFPGTREFVTTLLDPETGHYRYLSEYLTEGAPFRLRPVQLDHRSRQLQSVMEGDSLTVRAAGVDHGPVPALAYRVEARDRVVAFSGDQTGVTDGMLAVANQADLLVIHAAIPPGAGRVARNLHATPEQIGVLAQRAGVKSLVLSHWMRRSLNRREAVIRDVREHYNGPLHVAEDLQCFPVGG